MPLYDLVCPQCKMIITDQWAPIKDRDLFVCQKCGVQMHLLPAAPGLSFKGQDWTPKFYPN